MTTKVKGAALAEAVGVPVIAPVAAFNVSPAGSVPPVRVHLYGDVPPDADKEALYGVPTWPLGRLVVDKTSAVGLGPVLLLTPQPARKNPSTRHIVVETRLLEVRNLNSCLTQAPRPSKHLRTCIDGTALSMEMETALCKRSTANRLGSKQLNAQK